MADSKGDEVPETPENASEESGAAEPPRASEPDDKEPRADAETPPEEPAPSETEEAGAVAPSGEADEEGTTAEAGSEASAPAEAEQPAEAETPDEARAEGEEGEKADAEAEQAPAPTLVELASGASYSATGKRKSSVARVILRPGKGSFDLNGRSLDAYFPRATLRAVVCEPLAVAGYRESVDVRARIHGGGVSSQADALKHGIAKALIEVDPSLRGELKRRQLLTRDPRVKERRKAGLKKARKRPQFSKR